MAEVMEVKIWVEIERVVEAELLVNVALGV